MKTAQVKVMWEGCGDERASRRTGHLPAGDARAIQSKAEVKHTLTERQKKE